MMQQAAAPTWCALLRMRGASDRGRACRGVPRQLRPTAHWAASPPAPPTAVPVALPSLHQERVAAAQAEWALLQQRGKPTQEAALEVGAALAAACAPTLLLQLMALVQCSAAPA